MARHVTITNEIYRGYLINVRRDGCVRLYLDNMIQLVESHYWPSSRWMISHIRLSLADNVDFRVVLRRIAKKFGDAYALFWVHEQATKELADDRDDGYHYHIALFLDGRRFFRTSIEAMISSLKSERLVKGYEIPKATMEKIGKILPAHLIKEEMQGLGTTALCLNSISSVRFAVYWMSYLCKVKTKVREPHKRSFGATKLKDRRPKDGTRLDIPAIPVADNAKDAA